MFVCAGYEVKLLYNHSSGEESTSGFGWEDSSRWCSEEKTTIGEKKITQLSAVGWFMREAVLVQKKGAVMKKFSSAIFFNPLLFLRGRKDK